MVNRWFATGRGFANGLATSGTSFGQLVIVAILASILTSIGWRDAYLYLAIITVVVLLPLVVFGIKSDPTSTEKQLPRSKLKQERQGGVFESLVMVPRHFAKQGQFWILILVYSCCGFLDFFVVTHVVAFATDQGVGEVTAGNLLAIMGLCGLAGVLLTGALADAFGTPRPVILCFGLRAGVFLLILISQSTPSIMIYALVYGFTFLMTAPLTVVFAQNIFGSAHLGTISGIITTAHHIAAGFGAYLGAVIYDATGSYQLAYVLMLFIAILGGVATLFVREKPIHIPDN
jgi:predicted MFS family arabinose efflux permease